jgi:site-specific DNA-methyltransferase (adenine-specific)
MKTWRESEGRTDIPDSADNSQTQTQGRFPANLIHSGEQEVLELFPETAGGGASTAPNDCKFFAGKRGHKNVGRKTSKGSAARFFKSIDTNDLSDDDETDFAMTRAFYCAKASKKDRDEGLEGFEEKEAAGMAGNMVDGQRLAGDGTPIKTPIRKNNHPTVKPTALMSYLCRLITPPNGVVLDPYMGSGSTGKAAIREGFSFVGIELDPDYYEIAKARVNHEA